MWYLYLDESGDLGFDFVHKKPSNFFTVTILLVKGVKNNRALINGVEKTLRRKLNPRRKRRRIASELKGTSTSMEVKKYFNKQVADIPFELYCVTLNKRRASAKLALDKHRIYNYISGLTFEQVPIEEAQTHVDMIIDKSKSRLQMQEFNSFLINQLQGRIDPFIPLNIYHRTSDQEYGLQATDMFSWGVFRNTKEQKHTGWKNSRREFVVI